LKGRENFAVSLRSKKKREIINEKRKRAFAATNELTTSDKEIQELVSFIESLIPLEQRDAPWVSLS